jgi:hypothetical protein
MRILNSAVERAMEQPFKEDASSFTDVKRRRVVEEIERFCTWLLHLGFRLPGRLRYKTVRFEEAKREDWIMCAQDPYSHEVKFNTNILEKCSFDYFVNVILHECFHLFAHNVPNKTDVKRLRDDFGEDAMRLLDIEADFFVAEYLRDVKGYDLDRNLGTFYEGGKVFGDFKPRIGKFERFVGSVLSISNAYYKNSPPGTRELFLPTLKNILT